MKKFLINVLIIVIAAVVILIGVAVDLTKLVDYQTIEMANGETVVLIRPIVISKDKKTVSYKPVEEEIEVQLSYDSVVEINTAWN